MPFTQAFCYFCFLYSNLDGNPLAKRLFRRQIHRKENNFKMELKEMWCKIIDWIHLTQERHQRQNDVKIDVNTQISEKQKMFLPS
jgi:hypothetical protein